MPSHSFPARRPLPRRSSLLLAALGAGLAINCAKPSTQLRPDGSIGGGPPGGGGASGAGAGGASGIAAAPCPIAGTWQMTAIACGTIDQSASWFMAIPNTTTIVTSLPDGGCQMVVTSQSFSCRQTLVERVAPNAANTGWQVTSQGITECFPESCAFTPPEMGGAANDAGAADAATADASPAPADASDAAVADAGADARPTDAGIATAACKLGDRAGTRTADSIVMSGDMFVATAPTTLGICRPYGLPQVTHWMRLN